MITNPLSKLITDKQFNSSLPEEIRYLTEKHWTPASIAKRAAKFLVTAPGIQVLDIGSGVGKFCIIAAAYNPDSIFTGVEQRKDLCLIADTIARQYKLDNTRFIEANVTEIDFSLYSGFFFYNSFYENIESKNAIDKAIDLSPALYQSYTQLITEKLIKMPVGTRIVTYWSDWIPEGYDLIYSNGNDSLKFWKRSAKLQIA